ncbi:MAG: DEAD/DEAH box helicase, partial [Clostridiales bacterium]|nr:DEAD/DEAH box helicase [Clostridiales bacterium]
YKDIEFEYCIVDEAQYFKNSTTKTAKSVKQIKAKHFIALTGTPVENSIQELWSIFDFVMPGFLGNLSRFTKTYTGRESLLISKIRPFLLRRTKLELAGELPPKIEQLCLCDLSPEQLEMYVKVLDEVRQKVFTVRTRNSSDGDAVRMEVLVALTRLRQICNHPGLLYPAMSFEQEVSGKMELFMELLEESLEGGHKLLVFSQFVKMLEIIRATLDRRRLRYSYLDGKSTSRQAIIDDFNNDEEKRIFLISIKAGGFGLNLTSADTVIIFDPWWNPMVEDQAADRAHRMGQRKPVNVYRLVTGATVEEKIQIVKERKRAIFDAVVGNCTGPEEGLTWEDFLEIIS